MNQYSLHALSTMCCLSMLHIKSSILSKRKCCFPTISYATEDFSRQCIVSILLCPFRLAAVSTNNGVPPPTLMLHSNLPRPVMLLSRENELTGFGQFSFFTNAGEFLSSGLQPFLMSWTSKSTFPGRWRCLHMNL